jgi:hypothetical protein
MHTFTDATGRTWSVAINVDTVRRVKALAGVNLMDVVEGQLVARLQTDPVLLCDVLYAVCKPQADAQNVTDEDFGRSMAGDAIEAATEALLEDLTDFFPSGQRGLMRKALGKLKTYQAKALAVASQKLDSPDLEKRLEDLLAPVGGSSSSSPASSDATPAP